MAYSKKFKTFKVADNIVIMIFRTSAYDPPAVGKYLIAIDNHIRVFVKYFYNHCLKPPHLSLRTIAINPGYVPYKSGGIVTFVVYLL